MIQALSDQKKKKKMYKAFILDAYLNELLLGSLDDQVFMGELTLKSKFIIQNKFRSGFRKRIVFSQNVIVLKKERKIEYLLLMYLTIYHTNL